jgi:uncharacterized protein YbjT (DUF2867 family)
MENSNRIILVTGATGNQGGAVARHLLQRSNFQVRAFVRNENNPAAKELERSGAELVSGDLNDRSSLDRALQGVYGVFSVQGLNDGLDAEIREGKAIADAAKAAGIEHFVYSSVGSAERQTGVPHFDSKFQIEEYIRSLSVGSAESLGLRYTILRPVFFFYNYETMRQMVEQGTISLPLSPDRKLQQLSEADYGKMVAEVFARPADFANREPEVAAAFSNVLGKPITYQQIPFEAFEQQAGEEMTIMYRWFENAGYNADMTQLKRIFPTPTDLESYLRECGWAQQAQNIPAKTG